MSIITVFYCTLVIENFKLDELLPANTRLDCESLQLTTSWLNTLATTGVNRHERRAVLYGELDFLVF